MKLVIQTQYKENYSANNDGWDGPSENDHWKFKGGSTYVIGNIQSSVLYTGSVSANALYEIVDSIKEFICSSDGYTEEYMLDWEMMNDGATVCEHWETPVQLYFRDNQWTAMKVSDNRGENGFRRKEILEVTETWVLGKDNERTDYKSEYLMEDGDIVSYQELTKWFEDHKEVA